MTSNEESAVERNRKRGVEVNYQVLIERTGKGIEWNISFNNIPTDNVSLPKAQADEKAITGIVKEFVKALEIFARHEIEEKAQESEVKTKFGANQFSHQSLSV